MQITSKGLALTIVVLALVAAALTLAVGAPKADLWWAGYACVVAWVVYRFGPR